MRGAKFFFILCFLAVVFALWSMIPGSTQAQQANYNASSAVQQATGNYVKMDINASLPYRYNIWQDSSVRVVGNIQIWNRISSASSIVITIPMEVDVQSLPPGSNFTVVYDVNMRLVTTINVPGDIPFVNIVFSYDTWMRYVLGQAYVTLYPNPLVDLDVSGLPEYTKNSSIKFIMPSYCKPSQGSPFPRPTYISGNEIVYDGADAYSVPTIWYHSDRSVIISLIFSLILLIIPVLFLILLRKKILRFPGRYSASKASIGVNLFSRFVKFKNSLVRFIKKVDISRGAFIFLLITSILMLSVAIAVGSNPQTNVFVMANPETAQMLESSLQQRYPEVNFVVFTWWVREGLRDTLSLGREVDLMIIGDLPSGPIAVSTIQGFMSAGARLCVLEEYNSTPLASLLITLYLGVRGSGFSTVSFDQIDLVIGPIVSERLVASNLFHVSKDIWNVGVAIIAVLSILVVFFSALLISYLILNFRGTVNLKNLIFSIGYAAAIFGWAVFIYLITSSIITLAISSHAAPLNFPENLLAIQFLGFGGGSLVRLGVGGLGFFIALIVVDLQKNCRFNWKLVFPVVAAFLILTSLPVTGPILDDILLVGISGEFSTTPSIGFTLDSIFSASAGLYFLIFSAPEISRGIFMFFSVSVALLIVPKLSRNVRTVVVLALLPFFARGIMRVGDIDFIRFIGTLLSGVLFGIALVLILLIVYEVHRRIKSRT